MISFSPPCRFLLPCVILLVLGLVQTVSAQPEPPVATFDLVLVGSNLDADAHRISLKTNPGQGETWTPVLSSDRSPRCTSSEGLLVVPDLPAKQYVGQDIRENHLSLKIATEDPATEGSIRAVYALPSVEDLNDDACTRLARLIETDPSTVRTHSLAAYVRPRPAPLDAEVPFIDNIELPVRHHKPGVMEVEWLKILFSENS